MRVALSRSVAHPSKDDLFRQLVEGILEYAVLVLSPDGNVLTWNQGAEALLGYGKYDVLGTHFSRFYLPEAIQEGLLAQELTIAEKQGRFCDEAWHIRKDGSTFLASVAIAPLRNSDGVLCGFAKVTQDITVQRATEERINKLNRDLQALSAQMLHVQDLERRRIARELHDDLGQQLLALKMFVDKTKNAEAIELADSALVWVRNLSYLLHPPLLDEIGLGAALNWFVGGLARRSGVKIELTIRPDEFPRLGMDIETAAFRIIQESLTNVFRHSDSERATVELEKRDAQIVVRVRDYGKGIPANTVPVENKFVGVGIAGMRERIRQLGGELKLSRCEPGTLVEASLPLPAMPGQEPIAMSAANNKSNNSDGEEVEKPNVTLPGTVEKIIPAAGKEPEKAQITVEGSDDLYSEVRIENTLRDGDGKRRSLKEGADVEVTIEAEPKDTKPKE